MSQLPQNWARAVVYDVTSEARSGFASGRHNATGEGIAHLRPMNISRLGEIDLTEVKFVDPSVDDRRLKPGDILFNNTNSPALVGKTALVRQVAGEHAFSNHMTRLRTASGVVPAFLAAQLHFLWMTGRLSHLITNHVNQASISAKVLSSQVQVVLPPTAEQERIVAAIEEHLSRLDAAEAALSNVQARLSRFEELVYRHALAPTAPRTRLGDVARTTSGGTPKRTRPDLYGGTVPWIKSGELGDGVLTETEETITEQAIRESSAKLFPKGTVLIAMYGATIGMLGRVGVEAAATNQAIAALFPSDELDPDYLWNVLRALRSDLVRLGKGGAQPNISQSILRELEIPVTIQVPGSLGGSSRGCR